MAAEERLQYAEREAREERAALERGRGSSFHAGRAAGQAKWEATLEVQRERVGAARRFANEQKELLRALRTARMVKSAAAAGNGGGGGGGDP